LPSTLLLTGLLTRVLVLLIVLAHGRLLL